MARDPKQVALVLEGLRRLMMLHHDQPLGAIMLHQLADSDPADLGVYDDRTLLGIIRDELAPDEQLITTALELQQEIGRFICVCCIVDQRFTIQGGTIISAFWQWCDNMDVERPTDPAWRGMMEGLGFLLEQRKVGGLPSMTWIGLTLRQGWLKLMEKEQERQQPRSAAEINGGKIQG